MFIVTVTECPRVGQRKPRIFYFVVNGNTVEEARTAWKADNYSAIYGNGPDDKVEFSESEVGVYRLAH